MLSLNKLPLRNLDLPLKLKRLRDLFTINSCLLLRSGGTSVLRFVIEAKALSITNPIAVFGTLGINHFLKDGFGLNHPIILVCFSRNLKRRRRKRFRKRYWMSGGCAINAPRQTIQLTRLQDPLHSQRG